jgi:hypothetical protein
MGISQSRECRPLDAPCTADEQCTGGSICQAGRCFRPRSRWRVEVLADVAPLSFGQWNWDSDGRTQTEGYSLDPGYGLTIRGQKGASRLWDVGGYAGFLWLPEKEIFSEKRSPPVPYAVVHLSMLRLGFLSKLNLVSNPGFRFGTQHEVGFIFVESDSLTPGFELAADLSFDVPLGSGSIRPFLTFGLGLRANFAVRNSTLGRQATKVQELWVTCLPMIRVGGGFGR